MTIASEKLTQLVTAVLGDGAASDAITQLALPVDLPDSGPDTVSRAECALAMTVALHHALLARVPTAAAYADDCRATGRKILLDHGALRTIILPDGAATGAIPAGAAAFARILEPLGYVRADIYPLDRLRMTGYAWCHRDLPDSIAQFFVSELHVDRFDDDFAAAAVRIFGTTRDALTQEAKSALAGFAADGRVPLAQALAALPALVAAFDRHHDVPAVSDYQTLKQASAEAAWIATEGNAFNHGTDRVGNVETVADAQRAAGRAMKERIEVSGSGRVRQTAYRADWVERPFVDDDGTLLTLTVPGSFYEFIDRKVDPASGRLDLKFDSGNAQGIFKMTASLDA